jgi:hypothetical protein
MIDASEEAMMSAQQLLCRTERKLQQLKYNIPTPLNWKPNRGKVIFFKTSHVCHLGALLSTIVHTLLTFIQLKLKCVCISAHLPVHLLVFLYIIGNARTDGMK